MFLLQQSCTRFKGNREKGTDEGRAIARAICNHPDLLKFVPSFSIPDMSAVGQVQFE